MRATLRFSVAHVAPSGQLTLMLHAPLLPKGPRSTSSPWGQPLSRRYPWTTWSMDQRRHGVDVRGLPVFHDQLFREHDTRRQTAPSFLVAVVQRPHHVLTVGVVQKELTTLGHVVLAEADGHACGAWGVDDHAPHLVALLEGPSTILVARPCDVVLHAKPPWRLLETVCDFVFLRQGWRDRAPEAQWLQANPGCGKVHRRR